MRITDIYLSGMGPFQDDKVLHLDTDDERVLFLGISGSGKTTVFRAMSKMWLELGCFLEKGPAHQAFRGAMAMVIKTKETSAAIILGDEAFADTVLQMHENAWWMRSYNGTFFTSEGACPVFSNMCLMDGDTDDEECSYAPWLIGDGDVKGLPVLFSGLSDAQKDCFIDAANVLLSGKTLATDDNGGLTVHLASGAQHGVKDLSMGEKRIMGLSFLACACLEAGGVLLMDEPDVHLHPSQLMGLIATLENAVLSKGGQVFMISHHQEIWNRFDLLGKVIIMEGRA